MLHFFKLIRWPNLVVIIIAQLVVYSMILKTIPQPDQWYPITWLAFIFLNVMTITAAAAGNIINDIFDIEVDKINRKDRVLANGMISMANAKKLYLSFIVLGALSIGIFIYLTELYFIGFLYLFATFFLYYYSKTLKSTPGAGNFVVSFLCAGAIALVSWPLIFQQNLPANLNLLQFDLWMLIAFAFTISLARELSKDIFDMKGDSSQNLNTIPLYYGFKKAKSILIILLAILVIGLTFFIYDKWPVMVPKNLPQGMFLLTSVFILMILIITVKTKKPDKKSFAIISGLLKLMMVFGTFSFWLLYGLK